MTYKLLATLSLLGGMALGQHVKTNKPSPHKHVTEWHVDSSSGIKVGIEFDELKRLDMTNGWTTGMLMLRPDVEVSVLTQSEKHCSMLQLRVSGTVVYNLTCDGKATFADGWDSLRAAVCINEVAAPIGRTYNARTAEWLDPAFSVSFETGCHDATFREIGTVK